jgi:hypothetical protein
MPEISFPHLCEAGKLLTCRPLHIFDKGRCRYKNLFDSPEKTYESRVDYKLRFMLDKQVWNMIFELIIFIDASVDSCHDLG